MEGYARGQRRPRSRRVPGLAERDALAVARVIGEDVVWRVPGRSAMAGEYRGRAEIFAFLRRTAELTGGTYRSRLRSTSAAATTRGRGLPGDAAAATGASSTSRRRCVFRFEGEELQEVLAVPGDPEAFDAFWAEAP